MQQSGVHREYSSLFVPVVPIEIIAVFGSGRRTASSAMISITYNDIKSLG
jgi:hypothetical protein